MSRTIESLDRRIHPAKVILYRIKNWVFDLLWPKDVYGINRPGNCLDDSHLYDSSCKACNRPIDPKLKEDLIKNVEPFWKRNKIKSIDTPNRVYLISNLTFPNNLEPTRFCEDDGATKSFFDETSITFEREYNPKKGKKIRDL